MKINAVARSQLTFQMLALLQNTCIPNQMYFHWSPDIVQNHMNTLIHM